MEVQSCLSKSSVYKRQLVIPFFPTQCKDYLSDLSDTFVGGLQCLNQIDVYIKKCLKSNPAYVSDIKISEVLSPLYQFRYSVSYISYIFLVLV